jgi:poly(A) polymerase
LGSDRGDDRQSKPTAGGSVMKLRRADWQTRDGMAALLRELGAADGDIRFVGGCVRDTLLGHPVNDVDVATRLEPQEVMHRLKAAGVRTVPTGISHGTVTAILPGGPVEITTLRRDVSTDGRRAIVAYTDDWREDAARRDFTINALSADPETLAVHDYFGGESDLASRCVRFIGDPRTRIAEDHLRILRFFRFHARFGAGAPHSASLAACAERANDLMALSRERIADELLRLLALPDPTATIALMVERGILRPVLPEIGEDAPKRLASLIRAEKVARVAGNPVRRLAAVLPADPEVAASVGGRLRLSNKAVKRLVSAAVLADVARPDILAYRIGRDEAIDRLLLADDPAAASLLDWTRPHFGIGGGMLIGMGLKPGPAVARTLQAIEKSWADQGFPSDPGEQAALARRHVDQALREAQ